ncbi:MAG: hypothetical protein RLY86_3310 [Pseudomonadota bacterium]|jgi:AcrR family transcriptional regulator
MATKTQTVPAILSAAMDLAAEQGWSRTTLAEIARRADLPLAEIYRTTGGKPGILEALSRHADAQVLSGSAPDMEDHPRDRLFDVLMRRFDALGPYKPGLMAVADAAPRDPLPALCTLRQIRRSMEWMLEAAGLSADGWQGAVKSRALAGLWLSLMRVWFQDETEDQAKTMAALDARLRRLDEAWNSLPGRRRGRRETQAGGADGVAA